MGIIALSHSTGINVTHLDGGGPAQILTLMAGVNQGGVVTVVGGGNISLASNFALDNDRKTITFRRREDRGSWFEIGRSANA